MNRDEVIRVDRRANGALYKLKNKRVKAMFTDLGDIAISFKKLTDIEEPLAYHKRERGATTTEVVISKEAAMCLHDALSHTLNKLLKDKRQ